MGSGSSRSNCVTALNEITASAFLSVTTECQHTEDFEQKITIRCNPDFSKGPLAGLSYYEGNPQCVSCWENILERQEQTHEMMQKGWSKGNVSIKESFNHEFERLYAEMMGCLLPCKACIYTDWSQANNFQWKDDCTIDTTAVTKMKDTMSANITQALTNNQDVLSSLAKIFGASDKQSVTTAIMQRLDDRITEKFMQSLRTQLLDYQTISVQGGTVTGITQTSTVAGVATLVAQHNITNNLLSNEQWSVFQALRNEENEIDELGQAVKDSIIGIADVVNSLMGKILIGVIAATALILLVVAVMAIVNYSRHKKEREAERGAG